MWIYSHYVQDGGPSLFGFSEREERSLFETLLGVQGVGPKVALAILSGLPAAELTKAIAGADVARLTQIRGVGRKTAERLAVEEAKLAKELQNTEARLRVLRAQPVNRTGFGVQATSVNEIERFQAQAFDIRTRLREIRRAYTIDIERLRTQLLLLNTIAAPLLLGLIGLIIVLRRASATKKRAPAKTKNASEKSVPTWAPQ